MIKKDDNDHVYDNDDGYEDDDEEPYLWHPWQDLGKM